MFRAIQLVFQFFIKLLTLPAMLVADMIRNALIFKVYQLASNCPQAEGDGTLLVVFDI